MKKFVLFVMLMMFVASVSAQRWSLTPEVGMMAVKRGGPSYNYRLGHPWNARWKIGVGAEYVVRPDHFSLKSGLYYTQRGYLNRIVSFGSLYPMAESEAVFSEINSNLNRHFLQVPLMANFSFRLADHVRLNLAGGPYVAWSMGDKNSVIWSMKRLTRRMTIIGREVVSRMINGRMIILSTGDFRFKQGWKLLPG